MQLRRYGLKMQRIKAVFISHLHGDHYFGLIGLLNSLHLLGKTTELRIICPSGLKPILDLQMEAANGRLQFPIVYHFTDDVANSENESTLVYSDNFIKVEAFPLRHRIFCAGFLFREAAKTASFRSEKIEEYNIPVSEISRIKKGMDFTTEDGRVVPNSELTISAPAVRSYAYCTDTSPLPRIAPIIEGANLLYHEATFTEEFADRAKKTFHSTAKQAAEIASLAQVKKLIIGHFSARYRELDPLLEEVTASIPSAELAIEGTTFEIR